jgi:hypothetical protein
LFYSCAVLFYLHALFIFYFLCEISVFPLILSFIFPPYLRLLLSLLILPDTSARNSRNPHHYHVGEVAAPARRTEFDHRIPMLFFSERYISHSTTLHQLQQLFAAVRSSVAWFTGVPGSRHQFASRAGVSVTVPRGHC